MFAFLIYRTNAIGIDLPIANDIALMSDQLEGSDGIDNAQNQQNARPLRLVELVC